MEWLFAKRFWIVRLFFITICAVFFALIVNALLADTLAGRFAIQPKKMTFVLGEESKKERNFVALNERNLFKSRRENVVFHEQEEEEEDVGSCVDYTLASPSSLRLRLVGTVMFEDSASSLAVIEDLSQGKVKNHSINDCIEDGLDLDPVAMSILGKPDFSLLYPCNQLANAILQRIEEFRVYIYNTSERRCEYLSIEQASTLPPAAAAPMELPVRARGVSQAAGIGEGVRRTGANSFEIPAGELNDALGNLSEIATQARMVPAFEDGKPVGFRLFSVQPGSVFSKLGLENGDTILRINGYELNSPEKSLELYQKLRTSQEFTIDLKRGGSATSFNYTVKP